MGGFGISFWVPPLILPPSLCCGSNLKLMRWVHLNDRRPQLDAHWLINCPQIVAVLFWSHSNWLLYIPIRVDKKRIKIRSEFVGSTFCWPRPPMLAFAAGQVWAPKVWSVSGVVPKYRRILQSTSKRPRRNISRRECDELELACLPWKLVENSIFVPFDTVNPTVFLTSTLFGCCESCEGKIAPPPQLFRTTVMSQNFEPETWKMHRKLTCRATHFSSSLFPTTKQPPS